PAQPETPARVGEAGGGYPSRATGTCSAADASSTRDNRSRKSAAESTGGRKRRTAPSRASTHSAVRIAAREGGGGELVRRACPLLSTARRGSGGKPAKSSGRGGSGIGASDSERNGSRSPIGLSPGKRKR